MSTALADFFTSELLSLDENASAVVFVDASGLLSSWRYSLKMLL